MTKSDSAIEAAVIEIEGIFKVAPLHGTLAVCLRQLLNNLIDQAERGDLKEPLPISRVGSIRAYDAQERAEFNCRVRGA